MPDNGIHLERNSMKLSKILLGTLIAAASTASFAQTAELKVIGVITPSACTPVFTGGATIDLGKISAKSLNPTDFTYAAQGSTTLTITCDAPTRVAITTIDDRTAAGKPVGIGAFVSAAIGSTAINDAQTSAFTLVNGKQVGGYAARFAPGLATGDGAAVDTIASTNGAAWALSTSGIVAQNNQRRHTWAVPGTLVPTAHTVIVQPITVDAVINKVANMPALTNDVPLDGQMTFSVVYL
jgi:Protein of unknown function (DUF1120)